LSLQSRVTVVRPYHSRIRDKVFRRLEQAGLDMDQATIIASESSDDEVLRALGDERPQPDVLLIPFNAVRARDGDTSHGLELALRIDHELPQLTAPILMPLSTTASAAAELIFAAGIDGTPLPEELKRRILLLREDELHGLALVTSIRQHVSGER